jgi:hypothetical protein
MYVCTHRESEPANLANRDLHHKKHVSRMTLAATAACQTFRADGGHPPGITARTSQYLRELI